MSYKVEIVQDSDGSYYANVSINDQLVVGLPEYIPFTALKRVIKDRTGIVIPNKKALEFRRIGRKNYAYING